MLHVQHYGNNPWYPRGMRTANRICPQCGTVIETQSGYCRKHAAEQTRKWRRTHPPSEEQRLRGIARSYLNVYLRRRKVQRRPCWCGQTARVEAHHHNGYEHPLEVTWLCRPHHRTAHHR